MMPRSTFVRPLALALALCLLPVGVAAAGQGDRDAAFEQMLAGVETVPSRDGLLRAWPDARERLLVAARQDTRDGYTRARAIGFLGYFGDAGVQQALAGLAAHAQPRVRKIAIYTLGRTFGRPGDLALVKAIHALTADADPSVRGMAVRTLRWVDHVAAADALERVARDHADPLMRRLAKTTSERRARRLAKERLERDR